MPQKETSKAVENSPLIKAPTELLTIMKAPKLSLGDIKPKAGGANGFAEKSVFNSMMT
jgi:hypothetical protein